MLRFNEIMIVIGALLALGLRGGNLKILQKTAAGLAVEASKQGYMSLSEFNHQLVGRHK